MRCDERSYPTAASVSATRKVFMNRSNGPTKLLKKGAVSMPEVVTSRRQDADVSGNKLSRLAADVSTPHGVLRVGKNLNLKPQLISLCLLQLARSLAGYVVFMTMRRELASWKSENSLG